MRKCIGCMRSRPQNELMRFTADGASIAADEGTKRDGRGFYLCRDPECIETAFRRKAFNRILRTAADTTRIRETIEKVLHNN